MLPNPLNTVAELLDFTSFVQGPANGQDSVLQGTFAFEQFENALQQARNEIYQKTLGRLNEDFEEGRLAELKEAELWLATARLYRNYSERIVLKFPESNLAGVGEVSIGADTPSPVEKSAHWLDFMMNRIRNFGVSLLESPSTRYQVTVGREPKRKQFKCLARDLYSGTNCGDICDCHNL